MVTSRLFRLSVALLLALPALLLTSPASACACGGIASNDATARVHSETSILSKRGDRETIDMRLSMTSVAPDAALLVPTPAPATVSAGDAATFTRYDEISAPRVETRTHWWIPSSDTDGVTAGAAPPGGASTGAPTVVQRVTLGPLEAAVLAGGDVDGIRKWLSDNGYRLQPKLVRALAPYVGQHWSFVALKLASPTPLSGPLDPIRLTFDSSSLVYPMRMSAVADAPQYVTTYVVAEHRQQRIDADAAGQSVTTVYAGRIDDAYLTKITTAVARPATITTDFEFARAPTDDPVAQVTYADEDVRIFGVMAGPFLAAVGIVLAVLATTAVLLVVTRRRTVRRR